jgi:hypothetical protein
VTVKRSAVFRFKYKQFSNKSTKYYISCKNLSLANVRQRLLVPEHKPFSHFVHHISSFYLMGLSSEICLAESGIIR